MSAGSLSRFVLLPMWTPAGSQSWRRPAAPSFRSRRCQYWQKPREETEGEAVEGWLGEHGPGRPGPGRRRAGVRRTRRPLPARAAGALLPDPRLDPGRGGRTAGDLAGGLAGPGRVPGPRLTADLAVPDRHPTLPERAALGEQATAGGLAAARGRAARAHPARR